MNFLDRLSRSTVVKLTLAVIVYVVYAAVLGCALAPSLYILFWSSRLFLVPAFTAGALPALGKGVLFAVSVGISIYVFFYFGLLLFALLIRLLSQGVKPGKYPPGSLITLLWVVLNGVHTLAYRLILPLVPMTFFSNMYWRVSGCRIGKNVWLNSYMMMDAYLITIDDDAIIGGDAILSAHVFENGRLYLAPIHIGKKVLIGGHSYISPGVTVGDGAVIGMHSYVRKDRQIPPGTHIAAMAGLPTRRLYELERGDWSKGPRGRARGAGGGSVEPKPASAETPSPEEP
jgi:serine acetyltransferase